jgi:hypothetical protein
MSRENVAGYRSAVDALNQRDLDGFLALMDEEVHTESRLATMEGGYHGHDGGPAEPRPRTRAGVDRARATPVPRARRG